MKGDIHSYVLNTSSFLCDIREPRFMKNNTGYKTIKIVKYRLIPYFRNMIPCIVLPVSRLPDIPEKTAYTQMKGNIHLNTSSLRCNIGEPRCR